ncbi:MAG TPA: ABC transporter permease [Casimicrobiaceae bacterium]|jgi:putative spermidine/putrescine transport system permease protein
MANAALDTALATRAERVPMVDPRRIGRAALLAAAAFGYAVILTPLVFVCWLSFFSNEIVTFPPQGYTLRWYAHVFDQNNFVSGFVTSLQVGVAAMVGGLLVGIPASLVLARRRFVGREALSTLLLLPLVVPGVVAGTAIYVFQIEVEIATEWPLLGSLAGLVLAHIMITIPWTVRLITASLGGVDRSIEEAAQNLGATPLRTFLRVTLPAIKPGIVAAALFSFIVSFGNLEMTLFLVAPGRTTLPIAILQYLEWRIDPTIAAVSLLQIALIAAGMLITDRYVKLTRVL